MSGTQSRDVEEICMEARKVSKIYPGTVALNNVDFKVYRGKVNVLIGENGAGKSTLMKIMAGIEQPSSGEIMLGGEPVHLKNTRDAASKGIGIIHQELNLFPNLTVAQNIFMAREETKWGGIALNQGKHIEKTRSILEKLEHPMDPRTIVSNLKVGQQQIVEIAKTMARQDLRVLIMDEPTSSLSSAEVEVLFRLIQDLKSRGISIIYISHRLEEIMRIGDYITILRDGHLVAEDAVANIDIPCIVRHMVGRDQTKTVVKREKEFSEEVLRVESLTLPRPGGGYYVDDVSFSLHKGEVLGIYGLLGAGRTELLETLMGLHPEAKGNIYLEGKKIKAESVWKQIERGFAHIPEDRQREGLIQTLSIAKNMTLASLKNYTKFFYLSETLENKSIVRMIRDLFIKAPDPKLPILSLSGGNQQKVVIGKGMLTSPKIMLMDEPSRGIDVGAKADVYKIVDQLASQGLGIILVASELKEIIAISDRVLVMSGGKLTGEFVGPDISEENLVRASSGGAKHADLIKRSP